MSEINPFYSLSRLISQKYRDGARANRDTAAFHNMQAALAMHHAQSQETMKQSAQQARLTERSAKAGHGRTMHFAESIHGFAQPGTQVSVNYGDASASYTSKMPTPTAVSQPGRVPVKKVRGGKKTP
jgi:hypothetical protein